MTLIEQGAELIGNYDGLISDFADVMTVADFMECVEDGSLSDWDGSGYPVKDNMEDTSLEVFSRGIPPDATHVVWYNK